MMKQTQQGQIFTLPFAIDIYQGGKEQRYKVWMKDSTATYSFKVNGKPDLINADGDKVLLCEKQENKTLDEYTFQYKNAGLYRDRREAIAWVLNNKKDDKGIAFLKMALGDKSYRLRNFILTSVDIHNDTVMKAIEPLLVVVANSDSSKIVKAKAIELLGNYKNKIYTTLFANSIADSSYSVAGAALEALGKIDSAAAQAAADKIANQPAKGALQFALIRYSNESKFDEISDRFNKAGLNSGGFQMIASFADFLGNVKNADNFKKGVDMITKFRDAVPQQYRVFTDQPINAALSGLETKKRSVGQTELADYVKTQMAAKP